MPEIPDFFEKRALDVELSLLTKDNLDSLTQEEAAIALQLLLEDAIQQEGIDETEKEHGTKIQIPYDKENTRDHVVGHINMLIATGPHLFFEGIVELFIKAGQIIKLESKLPDEEELVRAMKGTGNKGKYGRKEYIRDIQIASHIANDPITRQLYQKHLAGVRSDVQAWLNEAGERIDVVIDEKIQETLSGRPKKN